MARTKGERDQSDVLSVLPLQRQWVLAMASVGLSPSFSPQQHKKSVKGIKAVPWLQITLISFSLFLCC